MGPFCIRKSFELLFLFQFIIYDFFLFIIFSFLKQNIMDIYIF